MYKINLENTSGAFTKAKIYHYDELPIKVPSEQQKKEIEKLVKNIFSDTSQNISSSLENKIDSVVYNLYKLTNDEIKIFEIMDKL